MRDRYKCALVVWKKEEANVMRIVQRLLVSVLVLVLIPFSVNLAPAGAQDEPVTLNLWMFLDGTGFLESVVEAFEAEHPNITINITDIPEDEYTTKIETAILAGQPPDIGFPYARRWVEAGYLAPLDEQVASGEIPLEDYNQGAISRNCYIDGTLYCVGSYTGGTVLFYNKDLFDAAGIPYPSATEAMSIDEYADIVRQLTLASDNPDEKVWGGPAPAPFWQEVALLVSEDGRTADGYVNDESTVHFYQVAADLIADGGALQVTEADLVQAQDLMATGRLAIGVGDSVLYQPVLEQAGINWGAAPAPVETADTPAWVYTGSDELAAFSGSQNLEAAKEFVTFWGTEGNRMRVEADGLSLNMSLAEALDWAGESEGRQEMFAAIQLGRPTVFIPEWYLVSGPVEEALNGLMVEDGLSAQEALDEVTPLVQDVLDENWETWEQIQPVQ
jgi:ABC-type glycerol-3-phosphate transport system substrate-binding protein